MSLLGTQVFATPDKPLWEPFGGSGGAGNFSSLTVTPGISSVEQLNVAAQANLNGGEVNVAGTLYMLGGEVQFADPASPQTAMVLGSEQLGYVNGRIESNGTLYLGQIGAGNTANSSFTPSAPSTQADVLSVGGKTESLRWGTPTGTPGSSMGTDVIVVGADNVVVSTTAVTSSSLIFFSRYGAPAAGPGAGNAQGSLIYNPTEIVPGTSFKVYLTDANGVVTAAATNNAQFIWWVIN